MSAPERTPLSRTIGMRPATASTIARQRVHRRDRAVDLAAAVVRHDDPAHPVLDRRERIGRVEDPLQQDRQPRPLAEEREVVPGQRRTRVRLDEAPHRCARETRAEVREPRARVCARLAQERRDRRERDAPARRRLLAERLLQRLDEHRVARVLGDALPAEERQRAEVEVADPPAEHRRVEREDDRGCSRSARPARRGSRRARSTCSSRAGTSAARRPSRWPSPPSGGTPGWRRRTGCPRPQRPSPPRRPHRGAPSRARRSGTARRGSASGVPSTSTAGLARRHVAKHPRDDAPALERRAVLAHRLLGAGAARDVRVALGGHALARRRFEALDRDGHRRIRPACAPDVDLELPLAPDPDGHAGTLTRPRARIAAMSSYPAAKRVLDVSISLVLLVVLSPVFASSSSRWASTCCGARAIAARGSTARRASRAAASSTS